MADRAAVPKSNAASPKIDAKQAKANAKAAKQAEKARKKASSDPADMGRIKQIRRAYQLTHEYDKALPFLLLGAFLLPIGLGIVFGLTVGYMVNAVLIGVGIGVLLPMMVLVRRAKAATFRRYAGQAGSVLAFFRAFSARLAAFAFAFACFASILGLAALDFWTAARSAIALTHLLDMSGSS